MRAFKLIGVSMLAVVVVGAGLTVRAQVDEGQQQGPAPKDGEAMMQRCQQMMQRMQQRRQQMQQMDQELQQRIQAMEQAQGEARIEAMAEAIRVLAQQRRQMHQQRQQMMQRMRRHMGQHMMMEGGEDPRQRMMMRCPMMQGQDEGQQPQEPQGKPDDGAAP